MPTIVAVLAVKEESNYLNEQNDLLSYMLLRLPDMPSYSFKR